MACHVTSVTNKTNHLSLFSENVTMLIFVNLKPPDFFTRELLQLTETCHREVAQ